MPESCQEERDYKDRFPKLEGIVFKRFYIPLPYRFYLFDQNEEEEKKNKKGKGLNSKEELKGVNQWQQEKKECDCLFFVKPNKN